MGILSFPKMKEQTEEVSVFSQKGREVPLDSNSVMEPRKVRRNLRDTPVTLVFIHSLNDLSAYSVPSAMLGNFQSF